MVRDLHPERRVGDSFRHPEYSGREVHSTAAEGAVSRTDKFGHSMPILKPVKEYAPGKSFPYLTYEVEHEGQYKGQIWHDVDKGIWHSNKGSYHNATNTKHGAVASLFSGIDPATAMDRKREEEHNRQR